jgi:hypothetical protein
LVPVTAKSTSGRHTRNRPLAPIENGRFGAVPGSHLGGVGLDLMLAGFAPAMGFQMSGFVIII